jgi:hypothetical protein
VLAADNYVSEEIGQSMCIYWSDGMNAKMKQVQCAQSLHLAENQPLRNAQK